MQSIKPHNKLKDTFEHEMIQTILTTHYTKKSIINKTKISCSTLRRITLNEEVYLGYGQFRKLLYMYFYCKELIQSKYTWNLNIALNSIPLTNEVAKKVA